MKRKTLGIFVCTLLMFATVLPVAGTQNELKNQKKIVAALHITC